MEQVKGIEPFFCWLVQCRFACFELLHPATSLRLGHNARQSLCVRRKAAPQLFVMGFLRPMRMMDRKRHVYEKIESV